eukprot:CAMPEP_0184528636 /NCGR_PEP_ID=MMETSP0198_2-20121128/11899_1 /TAXON_ID=1112570 /ORGANISM="Thraustochytrium sp., Strain LLF1b" /LENGTH=965 /DNA_ID=CAMNT_0026920499 /DNA_START=25 /DNA_END=2922 /DNA_ORIENTATION=+
MATEWGSLEHDAKLGLASLAERGGGELSDVRLGGLGGPEISAHRLVLCLRSPVLRARFRPGGEWVGRTHVDMSGDVDDMDVLKALVRFLYTDQVNFGEASSLDRLPFTARVFQAAHELQISLLEKKAGAALAETLEASAPTRSSSGSLKWFSATLGVLQFAMRANESEGCADPDLAKECINLLCNAVECSNGLQLLLNAIHDPVDPLLDEDEDPVSCLASVCSEVLIAIASKDTAMELGVLTGRADIVIDLIARGVDPDSPTSSGELPVELALRLSQQGSGTADSMGDQFENRDVEDFIDSGSDQEMDKDNGEVDETSRVDAVKANASNLPLNKSRSAACQAALDWSSIPEMKQIVETLILGGARDSRFRNSGSIGHPQPLLNLASKLGNARHVKALLDAKLDVNECDMDSGRSPLHCASEAGFEDVVQVLLEANAIPNMQDTNGCTALHLACRRGHLTIVKLLLPQANENIPDRFGWTALHHAARKGHYDVTRQLLQHSSHPISLLLSSEYDQGSTAIHLAACNAQYRVILVMVECAREIDTQQASAAPTHSSSNVPDESEATQGSVNSTPGQQSLKATCVLRIANASDMNGRTPLHRAAATACDILCHESPTDEMFRRACNVIEALLDVGADVCGVTRLGYTPLSFALGGNAYHRSARVSRAGTASDAGSVAASSTSASDFAVMRQRMLNESAPRERQRASFTRKLMSVLLGTQGGSRAIPIAGYDGVTPLHCAVRFGHTRAVPILIRRGADINVLNNLKESPLSIAREHWPLPLLANLMLKVLPQAPSWADNTFEHCQACGKSWSVTTWRHHCRHCSSLVCANCSKHRSAIPKYGIKKPVRVCNICFEALSWPSPEFDTSFEDSAAQNSEVGLVLDTSCDVDGVSVANTLEDSLLGEMAHTPDSPGSVHSSASRFTTSSSTFTKHRQKAGNGTASLQVRKHMKVKPRKASRHQVTLGDERNS